MHELLHGDCLDVLKTLDDCSIDAIVTDPPYGLSDHKPTDVMACLSAWLAGEPYLTKKRGFMGKTWDSWVPGPEVWRECFRVLKPGGHILAFAGSRTHDLMSIALRLAGFECRDTVMWVYGSGFPKSLDVSKAIDKAAGAEREVVGETRTGIVGGRAFESITEADKYRSITAPATEAAKQWEGWGTALKPAYEPVLLFRKPLSGTVAENVLTHGTGALNIDSCRIEGYDAQNGRTRHGGGVVGNASSYELPDYKAPMPAGRWPANLIHDGSEEVLAEFPETTSGARNGKRSANSGGIGTFHETERDTGRFFAADTGSAARYFYCAKASRRDRDDGLEQFDDKQAAGLPMRSADGERGGEGLDGTKTDRLTVRKNVHPTVKPTDLMRYLCRLVTPPNGVILDPFMGSGSTGKAAMLEWFRFIGIEQSPEYFAIARARIANAVRDNFS